MTLFFETADTLTGRLKMRSSLFNRPVPQVELKRKLSVSENGHPPNPNLTEKERADMLKFLREDLSPKVEILPQGDQELLFWRDATVDDFLTLGVRIWVGSGQELTITGERNQIGELIQETFKVYLHPAGAGKTSAPE